jgi:hypothetical protein
VLEELPINILGDGGARLRNVDSGCNGWSLGQRRSGWKTEAEKKQTLKEESSLPRNGSK